ncbi:hypothetical protein SAMN05444581_10528 [Methylocapsa palsarum]|uniref:Uncharacterized protein n=1 Tax=Methylocapsa palsarum TaxID=1612308 RepID=A0A1I3Y6A6_9HYPH|nr:hypothetical protein SAMN05444581_10528 [Methylocapsa palsarum]
MHVAASTNTRTRRRALGSFREKDFSERRGAAAEATAARLAKFRAQPGPDDPAVVAREAERKAIREAREKREAERAAANLERLAREAAEKAAREAQLEAERIAAEEAKAAEKAAKGAALAERAARVIADEAARKAERDRRYAARKARQG